MIIKSDELASILTDTLFGATAKEGAHLKAVIDRISNPKIEVRTDSESSLKLRGIVNSYLNILSAEMIDALSSSEIYCVDEPVCNAFAIDKHGRKQIIIFEGLLQTVKFYINLIKVMHLLNLSEHKPEMRFDADNFSTAAFALLVNYIQTASLSEKAS